MLSILARTMVKFFEEPVASRYSSPSEIIEKIRQAGGAVELDSFHESELTLVFQCVEAGTLRLQRGTWADPDWLMLPDYAGPG